MSKALNVCPSFCVEKLSKLHPDVLELIFCDHLDEFVDTFLQLIQCLGQSRYANFGRDLSPEEKVTDRQVLSFWRPNSLSSCRALLIHRFGRFVLRNSRALRDQSRQLSYETLLISLKVDTKIDYELMVWIFEIKECFCGVAFCGVCAIFGKTAT